MKKVKSDSSSPTGPCGLTQTTRQRGSVEYRDEVIDAPYMTSFPDGGNPGAAQDLGEGAKKVD